MNTKSTEELLTTYFKNLRILKVWRASVKKLQEQKQRLECRIKQGVSVVFEDTVKSPMLSGALPSNRPTSKGMEIIIQRAIEEEDKLIEDLAFTEIDIAATESTINRLEKSTFAISETLNQLDDEFVRVLELRLLENKSYEEIAGRILKSKSATYRMYGDALNAIDNWLRNMSIVE